MIKSAALILIIVLRIGYHPAPSAEIAPFASPIPVSTTHTPPPATVISFSGNITNKKVLLNWVVGDNETAYQFEVEKSTDGKQYTLVALVFGTDKTEKDSYQFYEKAGNQKVSYRIKLINKDRIAFYSPVIEITPTT
ncbi:MAG: hypothetical protein ABIR30_07950 [Chitinophagaceae bacterium]